MDKWKRQITSFDKREGKIYFRYYTKFSKWIKGHNTLHTVKKVTERQFIEGMIHFLPAYIKYRQAKQIIREYFRIVYKYVLEGMAWEFPKGFGVLKIVKQDYDPNYYYYKLMAGVIRNFNYKRIGFLYKVVLDSKYLEEKGVKYRAPCYVRKQLNKILTDTDKDYRYEGTSKHKERSKQSS